MQPVFQLCYIMHKSIQLPQNEVNAFTFVCPRKVSLFMPFLTIMIRLLYKRKHALITRIVCYFLKRTNKMDSHFNWADKTLLLCLLFWLKLISFSIITRSSFNKWALITVKPKLHAWKWLHDCSFNSLSKTFKLYASSFSLLLTLLRLFLFKCSQ